MTTPVSPVASSPSPPVLPAPPSPPLHEIPPGGIGNPIPVRGTADEEQEPFLGRAWGTVKSLGETGLKLGFPLGEIIIGVLSAVTSFISASFWKDNTLADYGSKALAIMSLILVGDGARRVYQEGKNVEPPKLPEGTRLRVAQDDEETNIKLHEVSVRARDMNFFEGFDPQKQSLINSADKSNARITLDLEPHVLQLLKDWTNSSVREKISYEGGLEPILVGVSSEKIPLGEFQDKIAQFIGYCVQGKGTTTVLDGRLYEIFGHADDDATKLELGLLVKSEFEKVLPADFVRIYNIASWYNKHSNSIDSLINQDGGISVLIALPNVLTSGSDDRKKLRDYLLQNQNVENYLVTLQHAIKHVTDPVNSNTEDPNIARDVSVYRSALITAFRLQGKNKDEINTKLSNVLSSIGGVPGLDSKVSSLQSHFATVDSALKGKENIRFSRGQYQAADIEKLSWNKIVEA